MKKLSILIIAILIVGLLTGCVQVGTGFNIHKDGKADIKFVITADKIMVGDEVNSVVWCLINSFPELQNNYEIKKEVKEIDYSDNIIYIFESKKSFDINLNKSIEFKKEGEKYSFKLNIPSLIEKVDEGNEHDLMFTIGVWLPKEIDIANSQTIEGNSVTWEITKSNLVKGIELKAITK
jgi:hypothetical protein